MDASVTELKTAILQAARGAGIPLAQSEDAARTLAGNPKLFLVLLTEPKRPFRVVGAEARGGRALWDAPTVADLGAGYGRVTWWFAPSGAADYLRALGNVVTQEGDDLVVSPDGPIANLPDRVAVSGAVYAALQDAAAKIYVPATDASRDGAGAGADGD